MSVKPVKAMLFDLGNVIVRFDPAILSSGYSPLSRLNSPDFHEYLMESDNINRYMEGKLTSSRFYMRTKKLFKLDISYGDFYRIWNSMFYPYPEVESILRGIKEKYPEIKLVMVSNTNEAHYDFIEREYGILSVFDSIVLSHKIGLQKPHPGIFNKALSEAGTLPGYTFYTDDREDLIMAARTMGLRAFQFTGHRDLRSVLKKLDIHV